MTLPHEIRFMPVNEFLRSDEAPPKQFWEVSPTSWHKLQELYDGVEFRSLDYFARHVGGLGGGTAIDRAKVSARRLGYGCVAIPSMLSTDVFATNKSAIVFVGKKVTVESVLPQLVIVDDRYLARSENENRHGVADILSIHTALMDWNLAEKAAAAKIDQPTYDRAQRVLNSMLEIPASQVNNRLSDVLMLVAEAGYITNDYGSGRPESGSEHIFASALELKMSMLHGAAVSLGIMIMTRVYDTVDRRVENYLCNLGMVEAINELKIPRALVTEVLQTLEPRQGRYTIVNRKLQWQEHIGVILDDLPVTFA